jgi:DNA-binding IclR family transcriptional regulator
VVRDRAILQSRGFLASIGHWNENINACAVPFWPDASQGPAAFLCGAHQDILPRALVAQKVGPLLLARVRELERSLGISELRPL